MKISSEIETKWLKTAESAARKFTRYYKATRWVWATTNERGEPDTVVPDTLAIYRTLCESLRIVIKMLEEGPDLKEGEDLFVSGGGLAVYVMPDLSVCFRFHDDQWDYSATPEELDDDAPLVLNPRMIPVRRDTP